MKTRILILLIAISFTTKATDDKFTQVMSKNIELVYRANSAEEYQNVVNAFDRIANAEKARWEPLYYSAFGNLMMAIREKDGVRKDKYLDLAYEALQKAKAIKSNESELYAMEGFVHMIRVTVDPATRGQQFSGKAFESYNKALALNPENPRALALMAQMEFGTSQFFNSPATEACNTNSKALEKFSSEKSDNPLAPRWGKSVAEELKSKCYQLSQK
jgi:tetratricopeptide (TPR) repeat protein